MSEEAKHPSNQVPPLLSTHCESLSCECSQVVTPAALSMISVKLGKQRNEKGIVCNPDNNNYPFERLILFQAVVGGDVEYEV